ncbi:MAG: hypothetical protein A6F72_00455 [Cycloclasticus sp. symbiont of Poecilosclerida sp. N]|nr:MAG: hypothetical protein A6F72_00455 [Cycloclasticus sp. symbiont of Poecilosclerida sp. N]
MTNNDILRRIRYTFDFDDATVINIFKCADYDANHEQISNWLKKDDAEAYASCSDQTFAAFLNGLIIKNRGKQDGIVPVAEKKLTNNIVLRKLKIALDLKNDDILNLMAAVGFTLGKHELSAFFRRIDHKHYRLCKDQVLRNFLQGIQQKNRPSTE